MTDLDDPVAVFRAAVDAINTEDWYAAVALVDPVSMRVFVSDVCQRLSPAIPRRVVTAEEYMKADPELPRAVAEYYVTRARRHENPAQQFAHELAGVDSIDALRAMPPEEVFARWLIAHSARHQVERLAAKGKISQRVADLRANAGFATYPYKALGAVYDGSDFVHVLYRGDLDPERPWFGEAADWLADKPEDERRLAREMYVFGRPRSATLRRQSDTTWRFVIEHDFLGMAALHIVGLHMDGEAFEARSDGESC